MSNPDIGSVSLNVQDGALGSRIGRGENICAVAGCAEKGPFTLGLFSKASSLVSLHGFGPAVEKACAFIEDTGKPVLFRRLTTSVAGSSSPVDEDFVLGTSVVTLTGTPRDDYEGRFEVMTGGTIGVVGIVFRYSLDGGRTFSPKIALGTAATYLIPNTGLTLNFGAGTLLLGDFALWYSTAPQWAASEFATLFNEFKALSQLWPLLCVVGPAAKTDLDSLETQVAAYATVTKRYMRTITSARVPHRAARLTGNPTVTFAAAGRTATRGTGSWINDGFKVGMMMTVDSALNDWTYEILTVTATVITLVVGSTLVDEGPVSGVVATGKETHEKYTSLVRAEFDPFVTKRIGTSAAAVRAETAISSHVANWKFRRHPSWPAVTRFFQFGPHESLAKVKNGPLPSRYQILNKDGKLEEHDSRAESGLASLDGSNGRFITVQTHDGFGGIYIAVPSLMHDVGSDFTRVHLGAVMDIACTVAQRTLTLELAADVVLGDDGFITEDAANTIERSVNQRLNQSLLSPPQVKASDAFLVLSRSDQLAVPGTPLTGKLSVIPLGYTEAITIDVSFLNPAAAAAA